MNNEMDGDEVLLGMASLGISVTAAVLWGAEIRMATRSRAPGRPLMLAAPVAGLILVFLVLAQWADDEVRTDGRYIAVLLFLGAAWMGFFSLTMHWLGISLRHDAVERQNLAATYAWSGAILGVTVLYAGANIGEGPSLWNNVFSAALGTGAMVALWLVLELTCKIAHSVAVERDIAAGLRLGGLMLAVGIIFGRALAGDWQSATHTVIDFVKQGWIAGPLVIVAIAVQLMARPTPMNPHPSPLYWGLLPAAVYLAAAVGWVIRLGKWK